MRKRELGIGLVGYRFMGRVHSNAYRQVARYFDVDPVPRMRAICGRDEIALAEAADTLGWEGYETDYRALIERDDVELIDVSTPGHTHREIVLAALEGGKHVFCEKPLANTLEEALEMLEAARKAEAGYGVVAAVNFNYRKAPAVALAKRLLEEGKIGEVRHFRAVYLQDWILSPDFPLVWRLQRDKAGSGALGDIGAHIVDLAHHLVGPIAEVVGTTKTFIEERPLEVSSDGLSASGGTERGRVTVDDATAFLARFENGAIGTFEATRLAPGRKNKNSFEINGSEGSIVFDLERMNELEVYLEDDEPRTGGFRRVLVTEPEHPYMEAWWPPGHIVGYEHTFVHAVRDLLEETGGGERLTTTFEDGYRCQAVLDAVERSAGTGGWAAPERLPAAASADPSPDGTGRG